MFKKAFILVIFLFTYFLFTFVKMQININGSNDQQNVDSVLVLGAAQYNGVASPALKNRTLSAIEVFKSKGAKYIIASGGKAEGDTYSEAEVAANIMRQNGIAESAIIIEDNASTTYDSMTAVNSIIVKNSIGSVAIVSDGYHLASSKDIAKSIWPQDVIISTVASKDPGYSESALLYHKLRETVRIGLAQIIGYRRVSGNGFWVKSHVKSTVSNASTS